MTAADQIYAHIMQHGRTTRPELERIYDLCEKTVDTAIRKLERLGYIKRDGMTPQEWRKRSAFIFVMTELKPDLVLIGDCQGRPRLRTKPAHKPVFDELAKTMHAFARRAA